MMNAVETQEFVASSCVALSTPWCLLEPAFIMPSCGQFMSITHPVFACSMRSTVTVKLRHNCPEFEIHMHRMQQHLSESVVFFALSMQNNLNKLWLKSVYKAINQEHSHAVGWQGNAQTVARFFLLAEWITKQWHVNPYPYGSMCSFPPDIFG